MTSRIFFIALAIRWIYAAALFAILGVDGLTGNDSLGYLASAEAFANAISSGAVQGPGWIGPQGYAMPLFQWTITLCVLIFGQYTALGYVLLQGLLDSGTCVLVYYIAREIDPRYAKPAGIVAALNPTQIVLSALVYTDTPFLFFIAIAMYATVKWLKAPTMGSAATIGLAFGAATLTRALAAAFIPVVIAFMATVALMRRQLAGLRLARQLATLILLAGLLIGPVLVRNLSCCGAWSLTPQGGLHLALWVAPLVKETKDGTPWRQSYDQNQALLEKRFPTPAADLFEYSRRYTTIAKEQLAELGFAAVAKAWLTGSAINLAAPAIILSPPVSHLPRTGFYSTPGATAVEKILNFMFRSDNATYAWILITGIAGVVFARIVQLIGVVTLLRDRQHWPVLCLFVLWTGYILAINGPVASPKYRLPLEVPFGVLAGAGIATVSRRTA